MPKFVVWFWPLHHQTAFHYITFFLLLSFCGSRVPTGFAFWEVYHRKQPLYWTYSWKTIEVRQRHQEVFQTQICFSLSLLVHVLVMFPRWMIFANCWICKQSDRSPSGGSDVQVWTDDTCSHCRGNESLAWRPRQGNIKGDQFGIWLQNIWGMAEFTWDGTCIYFLWNLFNISTLYVIFTMHVIYILLYLYMF